MATRATKLGRKKGGYNRGFFFRTGRGWCANNGQRAVLLRNEDGEPLRDRDTPTTAVREAQARLLMGLVQAVVQAPEGDQVLVQEVCELYLNDCKATGADATYRSRADALFDFCSGLPAAFRNKSGKGRQKSKKEIDAARIHRGYGNLRVCDLLPLHVDQWLQAHPSWAGSRRTRVQALKRAMNYCVEAGVLTRNPIKGFKTKKSGMRMTYLTPEHEAACYEHANVALATAIKVCIRTGARYGSEFAKLTAKHLQSTAKGMEWRFSEKESKNHKLRVVRIPNSDVVQRFRSSVETQRLKEVVVEPSDYVVIYNAMTKCSKMIRGHDTAGAAVGSMPTPAEIEADIEELQQFIRSIKARRKAAEETSRVSIEAPVAVVAGRDESDATIPSTADSAPRRPR